MPPEQPSRIPIAPTILGVIALVAGVGLFGRALVSPFRPPAGEYADFVQEWLSAKNYFSGHEIYEDQLTSFARHQPDWKPDQSKFLPYNAHPPVSVLEALPFAHLDYPNAHFAWNLTTFPMFLIGVALLVGELGRPFQWWYLIPMLALIVWADPIRTTLLHGQVNFLLFGLLAVGWVADRRGYQSASGIAVGLATGLKLFPGLLLVYFLFAGRWRAAIAMVLSVVVLNAVAFGLFGSSAFRTYVQDVMPSLQQYQSAWRNSSLNGFWIRLFDPHPVQTSPQPYHSGTTAKGLFVASGMLIAGAVAVVARMGRAAADSDRGWAVAILGMMLASPIVWSHYHVLLAIPLGVLAHRLPRGPLRWLGWIAVAGLCLNDRIYAVLFVSKEHMMQLTPSQHHLPLSMTENLIGISMKCYLTLILFALTLVIPRLTLTPASHPPAAGPDQSI
jgi:hypothetical protein